MIANKTYEIKILLQNRDLKITRFLPGFSWMGSHFAITSKKLQKTRLYSTCLCLNSEMIQYQNLLIENIKRLENNESPKETNFSSIVNTKYLEFYMKKYDFENALSSYINSDNKLEDLTIKGPMVLFFKKIGIRSKP